MFRNRFADLGVNQCGRILRMPLSGLDRGTLAVGRSIDLPREVGTERRDDT